MKSSVKYISLLVSGSGGSMDSGSPCLIVYPTLLIFSYFTITSHLTSMLPAPLLSSDKFS